MTDHAPRTAAEKLMAAVIVGFAVLVLALILLSAIALLMFAVFTVLDRTVPANVAVIVVGAATLIAGAAVVKYVREPQ